MDESAKIAFASAFETIRLWLTSKLPRAGLFMHLLHGSASALGIRRWYRAPVELEAAEIGVTGGWSGFVWQI